MHPSPRFRPITTGLAVCSIVLLLGNAALASTTSVEYSFAGDEDGEYPSTDLVMDGAGNLYGTSVQGGNFGGGTVFRLSPTGTGWTHTVLYSFTGLADGAQPYGGVTLDSYGNLYGTTVVGGSRVGPCVEDGCGVAYVLINSGGTWTEHVLHAFTGGSDGFGTGAGLTYDGHGNLYGMAPDGGAHGLGVIYQLHRAPNGPWAFRVIHSFTGGADGGSGSPGRLLPDRTGGLYGAATTGGANGAGVVFLLRRDSGGVWRLRPVYAFQGRPDAGFPYGGLRFDPAGNLFGTTYSDGANGFGAVYELTRSGGTWLESVVYSFQGGTDGIGPISNVVFDWVGNVYGTTSEGGGPGCGCGVIFKLARGGSGAWTESVVHDFAGPPDAAFAYNGMVSDGTGHFFGATVQGGVDNEGAVYEFTP